MAKTLTTAALLEPATGAYIAAMARALAQQAEFCVDRIERNATHAGATVDDPYYAILGEVHDQSLHGLFHLLVGLGLRERGHHVAIGLERPHNQASMVLKLGEEQAPCEIWGALRARLQGVARDDVMHHHITQSFSATVYNNQQGKICAGLWQDAGIPVVFNDAACDSLTADPTSCLDATDPVLHRILDKAGIAIDPHAMITTTSAQGVYYRNHVMASLAQQHAKDRHADIYLQIVGDAHVAGMGRHLPYQDSLMAVLDATALGQKCVGIPVLSADFNQSALPAVTGAHVDRGIMLDGPGFHAHNSEEEILWLQTILPQILPDQKVALAFSPTGPLATMTF